MKNFEILTVEVDNFDQTDVITTSTDAVFSQAEGVYVENGTFTSLNDLLKN